MKFFLNDHFFLSVIDNKYQYSCQVMSLVHGIGMSKATITEDQDDVVSCVVYENCRFKETFKMCNTLEEVAQFHLQLVKEILYN